MKDYCYWTWPAQLCTATRKFLETFQSYRHMLKFRPKVRFDGIYMCKLTYYRKGLSEMSATNPIHEVVSYRYIRFQRHGTTISTQTVVPPKKAFPKIRQHLLESAEAKLTFSEPKEAMQSQMFFTKGTFTMHNDNIVVIQNQDATDYRYDFVGFRKQANSKPVVNEDHIELVWQGFQIDQSKVHLDAIQLLSV